MFHPNGRLTRLAIIVLAVALGGCGGGGATPSFDPTGPCTTDGTAAGAYPELEALIPATYEERAPDILDSGRNCSAANLGSLAPLGIKEVRFAGGTWDFGSDIAVVLAVFTADDLTAEALANWWETTARAAGRTQVTGEFTAQINGRDGHRLDTKTGERMQTVVSWPSAEPGRINVVLSHNLPDSKIDAAIKAFGDS